MAEIKPKTPPETTGIVQSGRQLQRYYIQFLEYLEIERNRSKLTLRSYDHYLKRFVDFCAKQGVPTPEDIDLELVRSYRLFLNRMNCERSRRTTGVVRRAGQSLKSLLKIIISFTARFLKYLAKRDIKSLAPEKIELPKTPARHPEFLTIEEVDRLIEP